MKKLLLSSIILIPVLAMSQAISFSPSNALENTYDANDYPSEYIYFENTGSDQASYSYEVVSNTCESIGWTATLCTNLGCFPDVPNSGSAGTILAGEEGFFNPHLSLNGIGGTGEIVIQLTEDGNAENTGTITFIFHAEVVSSIASVSSVEIKVFPNPTTDFLQFNFSELAIGQGAFVNVYDMSGSSIINEFVTTGLLDVSELSSGNYLVKIVSQDTGEIISTRFIKA